MTRKLLIVNMSNWADEAFEVEGNDPTTVLRPGEFAIFNPYDGKTVNVNSVKVGEANGYEPPRFPAKAIVDSQED